MDAATCLSEARRHLADGAHALAAAACRRALSEAPEDADAPTREALCLTLLRASWQQEPAADRPELLEEVERCCPQLLRCPGYYHLLTRRSFDHLSHTAASAADPGLEAMLLRLLGEPPDAWRGALGLGALVLMILNAPQLRQRSHAVMYGLISRLDALIAGRQLRCPVAVLVSTASADEERLAAFRELLGRHCHHAVQLCAFHPRNRPLLADACAAYVAGGAWRTDCSEEQLYYLMRTVCFADQQLGWQLLAQLDAMHPGGGHDPSTPLGLLQERCRRRAAGLHLTAQRMPPPQSRPLRIALCFGGQLRGCTQTLESLSEALGLQDHQVHVFVHSWRNIGRKFPIPTHAARVFGSEMCRAWHEVFGDCDMQQLQERLQACYPRLLALLHSSAEAAPEQVAGWFAAEAVVLEDESEQRFTTAEGAWDNPRKMYYKLHAAHELARHSGRDFDLIIRARPDLRCRGRCPNLHELYASSRRSLAVFTPGALFCSHIDRECLIDDNLAVGVPEVMQTYADTYTELPLQLQRHTWDCPPDYAPHVSLEHQLFCGGIEIRDLGVEISFAEPAPLCARDLCAALRADCAGRRGVASDRLLLRACENDLRCELRHERRTRQQG